MTLDPRQLALLQALARRDAQLQKEHRSTEFMLIQAHAGRFALKPGLEGLAARAVLRQAGDGPRDEWPNWQPCHYRPQSHKIDGIRAQSWRETRGRIPSVPAGSSRGGHDQRALCKQEVTGSIPVGSIFLVGKQTVAAPLRLHRRSEFARSHSNAEPCDSTEQPLIDAHKPTVEHPCQGDVLRVVGLRPAEFISHTPSRPNQAGRRADLNRSLEQAIEHDFGARLGDLFSPCHLMQHRTRLDEHELWRDQVVPS
jgi:hypothetical protein